MALINQIYSKIPFKQSIFEVCRRLGNVPESVYKHLHFQGDFEVEIDSQHSFIVRHYGFQVENELFWAGPRGGWEKASLSLWIKLVPDAKMIFDVGANTGIYSLVANAMNPTAEVHAFEPVERVFEKLRTNAELNKFDIICSRSALSNFDGEATIYDTLTPHVYSVTVNQNLNHESTEVIPTRIRTERLDSYVAEHQLSSVDLIKIDVETHEPEVIEGCGELLAKFRPTILIEILTDDVGQKVEAQLVGMNYLYFNIDETSGSVRRVDEITRSDYYNYLVCQPNVAERLGLSD